MKAKVIRALAQGLLFIVVGGGTYAAATMMNGNKVPSLGSAIEPFYGAHQSGIEVGRQANLTLLALDINDGVDASAVARLLRVWSADAAQLTAGLPIIGDPQPEMAENPARLSILIGFGYSLFSKTEQSEKWPLVQNNIPHYSIDALEDRWNGGDIVLQITGDNPIAIFHAALVLVRDAQPFAHVRWQQNGFLDAAGINPNNPSRNLMGQIDGTANKPIHTSEFSTIAWKENGPLAGGTTMVVRRIEIDSQMWDLLSPKNKESALGRSLPDGEKVDSKSATSHVSRAFTEGTAGIIRRGFNFDDGYSAEGEKQSGLVFISFQANLKNYLDIQSRLNEVDDLNRWTTPTGSALFIVPAGIEKGDYLGSAFFK